MSCVLSLRGCSAWNSTLWDSLLSLFLQLASFKWHKYYRTPDTWIHFHQDITRLLKQFNPIKPILDIRCLGVWSTLKRKDQVEAPKGKFPCSWPCLKISLCVGYPLECTEDKGQSHAANASWILKAGYNPNNVHFTHFVNQHIKIAKTCWNMILENGSCSELCSRLLTVSFLLLLPARTFRW